jgi:hypothetical protein
MFETGEQTHVYEADTIALPSIRVVLGEVPNPDPVHRRSESKQQKPVNHEMIAIVRRIIARLENDR